MHGEIVAKNYASALFEIGSQAGKIEEFGEALTLLGSLLDEQPDVRLFLETPRIETREKKNVLRETFGERVPRQVLNFFLLVVDKGRQRLFREIGRQYHVLLDDHMGRAHVEVSVARPLDPEVESQLGARLSSILNKDVVPHVRVKPEILGGIVFRSGDIIFDGSVRRRLEDLRRGLLAAEIPTN